MRVLILIFIFLTFTSFEKELYPLDFSFDQQELYLGYRQSKVNANSKSNPNILDLEKYYFDLRHYTEFKVSQERYMSLNSKFKSKFLISNLNPSSEFDFEELYVSLSPTDRFFIDVGRKNMRWGTGYAWGLIEKFNDETRVINEDNQFKNIFLVQFFQDSSTAYSFVNFNSNSNYALKYHQTLNNFDYDVYVFNNGKPGVGLDFSSIVSDALEIHFEGTLQKGCLTYYPTNPTQNIFLWEQYKNNSSIYGQFILGGQYTPQPHVNMIIEYFHTSLGLNSEDYKLLELGLNESIKDNKYQQNSVWRQFLFEGHTHYQFAAYRQNYLFFRVKKEELINNINLAIALYHSLDEGSSMVFPTIEYQISDNLIGRGKIFIPIGGSETEFKRFYDVYGLMTLSYVF